MQLSNPGFDLHLRSQSMSPGDSKSQMLSSTYATAAGATMAARASSGATTTAPRKKRAEPGIARTFTSFTNLFKSSTPATASQPTSQPPAASHSPNSASTSPSPSSPKVGPIAVPSRTASEYPNAMMLADDELRSVGDEPRSVSDDYEAYDDSILKGTSLVASSYAGSRSPRSRNDTSSPTGYNSHVPLHAVGNASGSAPGLDDSLNEDDGWVTTVTPPLLSASVSRAMMREKSVGPALMPNARRVKRINTHIPSNSDYVSRRNPTRDGISLNSSSASVLNNSGALSLTLSSSQTITKTSLRKASILASQATLETEIDFPLCQECSMDVLNDLDDEDYDLAIAVAEYEKELSFMSHEYFGTKDFSLDMENMQKELKECEDGIEEFKVLIGKLGEEGEIWRAKGTELMMARSEYWRQFEIHAADREAMLENTISAHNRLTHARNWLDLIRSSHVVNDSFPISLDLHLATIGGLRLGRLPSQPTEWPEISAALGLTLHLLHELSLRASFVLPKYRLVLDGSFSGLQKVTTNTPTSPSTSNASRKDRSPSESGANNSKNNSSNGKGDALTNPANSDSASSGSSNATGSTTVNGAILPLYSDGDISLMRLMHFKSVNDGVAALTECIFELSSHLKLMYPMFSLPFAIVKDSVGGMSVRRAWNSSGATWSNAMRSLLANLKYILAFEAKQGLCV